MRSRQALLMQQRTVGRRNRLLLLIVALICVGFVFSTFRHGSTNDMSSSSEGEPKHEYVFGVDRVEGPAGGRRMHHEAGVLAPLSESLKRSLSKRHPIFFNQSHIYPNYNSSTGYLFLDPPRIMSIQHNLDTNLVKALGPDALDWKFHRGAVLDAPIYWIKRDSVAPDKDVVPMQMLSFLDGHESITSKGNLALHLLNYERVLNSSLQPEKSGDGVGRIHPLTYPLQDEYWCRRFFEDGHTQRSVWIVKEVDNSRGRGLEITRNPLQFLSNFYEHDRLTKVCRLKNPRNGVAQAGTNDTFKTIVLKRDARENGERIVQEYLLDPLLLDGFKSEMRVYWLVASCDPWIVLYFPEGTVRRTTVPYNRSDLTNQLSHVVNTYQQKRNPHYHKHNVKQTFQELQEYLLKERQAREKKGGLGRAWEELSETWLDDVLRPRHMAYLRRVFMASRQELAPRCKRNRFALFGADFVFTEDLDLYLTEVQFNPGLSLDKGTKMKVLPPMLRETIDVALEVQHRKIHGLSLRKLETLKQYRVIVNEAT